MRRLIKKRAGVGDLFVSMIAILAITLVTFLYINSLADIQLRTNLDQVARKYILIMESEGDLTSTQKQSMKEEMKAVSSDITNVTITTTGGNGYGTLVTLRAECTAKTTNLASGTAITKRDRTIKYIIEKQSTAKY